jgi:hypothetical protein
MGCDPAASQGAELQGVLVLDRGGMVEAQGLTHGLD